jgi:hypothetical protein
MNAKQALLFVEKHGVVLVSARGPVPRLTEAIINDSIKGSWWAHPKSRQIFKVLQTVTGSQSVLICRLVNGKVTLVHRRLWPALVRVARQFPARCIAQVIQEHTASGRHITREVPFPNWVPTSVLQQAKKMSAQEALAALGTWTSNLTRP